MHAADALVTSLAGLTRQQYETMNECNLSFTRPALQFIGLLDGYNVQNTDDLYSVRCRPTRPTVR